MTRPKRLRRLRAISLSTLVPNMITVLALCAGLTGVRFALLDRWEFAVGAIVVAAILDSLDGHMARLLKGQSRFGAELDSLSDFISFGAGPALILFLWTTQDARGFGWMASLFYSICMALRLARFNTGLETPDNPPLSDRFFVGVPAPAAAGLAILPMVIVFESGEALTPAQPWLVAAWMVLIGILMVSTIPTFSLKRVRLPSRLVLPTIVTGCLVIAGLLSAPWLTLAILIVLYLCSIPFSIRAHRQLTSHHDGRQDDDDHDGDHDSTPPNLTGR